MERDKIKGGNNMNQYQKKIRKCTSKIGLLGLLMILPLLFALAGCVDDRKPVSSSFGIEGVSIEESTDYLEINLSFPSLSGFDGAEEINQEIGESIAAARTEVEDAASIMESDGTQMKAGLHTNYLYTKNGDVASLWIMFDNYTGGAHGIYWIEPYTFNPVTNERYDFSGLFQEGKASALLVEDEIINIIKEHPELYFESAVETVKNYETEFQYYINGNQISVFFPLYDITAYAGGIQFFDFDAEELKTLLKPEIYEAIKNAAPINTEGTISGH